MKEEKEEMEKKLALFWEMYDEYIQTGNVSLRGALSYLLKQIEKPSRRDQLLRPEKGWEKILAWQVLRNQSFIFSNNSVFVHEGEVIIWLPHWDRDVFITRIPKEEVVSGSFLKPGFSLTYEEQGGQDDSNWGEIILRNGITDERGLYLPLYESSVVLDICNKFIAEKKKEMLDYFAKEKGWR